MRRTLSVFRSRDATGTAYARDAGASPDGCHAIDVTAATAAHRIADLSLQPSLTWDILMEGRPIELASLRGVRKQYGKVVALDGVDLAIAPGPVLALLGANGAGKSTAIALLLGLVRPDAGQALLSGQSPQQLAARGRKSTRLHTS